MREDGAGPTPPRLPSLLGSRRKEFDAADHSLSVAGELAASSVSPMILRPLEEVEPLTDKAEELALPLSFSSKPMKIRDLASL